MLMTGWVLTVGTHTVSQVMLTTGLHESMHFASVYRFFSRASWDPDHVGQLIFRMMQRVFKTGLLEIVCVLDDTMNSHRGPVICGAGWQYDGSGKTGYGVCFVIIGLAVSLPGISDRVFCLPFAARLWWPPNAEVKPETIPYRTKPEISLELIKLTRSWLEEGQTLRFITSYFSIRTEDTELEGTLIIGWDPIEKRITSWMFDSAGGFATGIWSKEGPGWQVKLSRVLNDGTKGSEVHSYERVQDTLVWKAFSRMVSGEKLPDIGSIKAERRQGETQ